MLFPKELPRSHILFTCLDHKSETLFSLLRASSASQWGRSTVPLPVCLYQSKKGNRTRQSYCLIEQWQTVIWLMFYFQIDQYRWATTWADCTSNLRLYIETFSGNKHKFILNGVNLAKLTGIFFTVPAVTPREIFNINPMFSMDSSSVLFWTWSAFYETKKCQ